MPIEAGKLKEEENKKKKLTEKENKENNKKILEHKKTKEKISVEIEADENLDSLKNLIQKWIITEKTAEKIIAWENIDEKIVTQIFEQIGKIEAIKDVDKYLPKELRITKEEYSKALHDDIFRTKTITKLDSALTLLSHQVNPDTAMWLNLFSGFLTILDKNLILIQEHNIDIKNNLKTIEKAKNPPPKNLSLWEKVIKTLKEIFVN
jgi:hypothetical protein